MVAFVAVVDTPYFGKVTDSGSVALELPAGRYKLRVWHPDIAAAAMAQEIEVGAAPLAIPLTIELDPNREAVAALAGVVGAWRYAPASLRLSCCCWRRSYRRAVCRLSRQPSQRATRGTAPARRRCVGFHPPAGKQPAPVDPSRASSCGRLRVFARRSRNMTPRPCAPPGEHGARIGAATGGAHFVGWPGDRRLRLECRGGQRFPAGQASPDSERRSRHARHGRRRKNLSKWSRSPSAARCRGMDHHGIRTRLLGGTRARRRYRPGCDPVTAFGRRLVGRGKHLPAGAARGPDVVARRIPLSNLGRRPSRGDSLALAHRGSRAVRTADQECCSSSPVSACSASPGPRSGRPQHHPACCRISRIRRPHSRGGAYDVALTGHRRDELGVLAEGLKHMERPPISRPVDPASRLPGTP